MIQKILECKKCQLYTNQPPLLDINEDTASIIVVGLSAKKKKHSDEIPLDNSTFSGKLVLKMAQISKEYGMEIYRTNLVKCLPLDDNGHLRYPDLSELSKCYSNFVYEQKTIRPSIVVIFGRKVQKVFEMNLGIEFGQNNSGYFRSTVCNNCFYVASHHPSFIMKSSTRQKEYLASFKALLENIVERKP